MNDPGICEACNAAKTITFHCRRCGIHCDTSFPIGVWCAFTEMCGPCITEDGEIRQKAEEQARTAWIQKQYVRISDGDMWQVLGEIYDETRDY